MCRLYFRSLCVCASVCMCVCVNVLQQSDAADLWNSYPVWDPATCPNSNQAFPQTSKQNLRRRARGLFISASEAVFTPLSAFKEQPCVTTVHPFVCVCAFVGVCGERIDAGWRWLRDSPGGTRRGPHSPPPITDLPQDSPHLRNAF